MGQSEHLDDLWRPGRRIVTETEVLELDDDAMVWVDIEGASPDNDFIGSLEAREVKSFDPTLPSDEDDPLYFHMNLGTIEIFHGVRVQTITIQREEQTAITVVGRVAGPLDAVPEGDVVLYEALDEDGEDVELDPTEYDMVYERITNGEDEAGV
jgi:hypothetical protein